MKHLLLPVLFLSLPMACRRQEKSLHVYRTVITFQAPTRLGGSLTTEAFADTATSADSAYRKAYCRYFSEIYHSGRPGVEVLRVPVAFKVYDAAGKEVDRQLSGKEKEDLEVAVKEGW